jgi:O-antigen biosynthesis protein
VLSELAVAAAWLRPKWRRSAPSPLPARPRGVSVVIPSRDGRELLAAQLPGIAADGPSEILVVDNGSGDGTAAWLGSEWPAVRIIVSAGPLSFAKAVNRGIREARYSHVCLLNNDMLIEPGFFAALLRAFDRRPDLFCSTAQIRFPAGVRREETGKAVMRQTAPDDFPVRCDEPLPGEDGTWVLYGSGGCSLYDAAKLHELGNVDEVYDPAYVEDLDLGYRAWLRGWPSVYVAGAVVEHRHRATTSRYYTEAQLQEVLEVNYYRFLARAVVDRRVFLRLWRQALRWRPRWDAWRIALAGGELMRPAVPEEQFLSLTGGSVAIFPGCGDGVLVERASELHTPPAATLARYAHVVQAREEAYNAAVVWSATLPAHQ